jgi:hypothetical protein
LVYSINFIFNKKTNKMKHFLSHCILIILVTGVTNILFSQNSLSVSTGNDVTVCAWNHTNLNAEVNGGESPYSYRWDNTNNAWDEKSKNPWVFPSVTTNYTVTVTDSKGNTATDNVTIFVNPRPLVNAGSDVTICNQTSTILKSYDAQGGTAPFTYSWSPTNTLSDGEIQNPIASPTVTTNYSLTLTDSKGCSATDQVIVTVVPKPMANAGVDVSICPQSSTLITGLASGGTPPYTFYWTPASGLSAPNIAVVTTSPLATTTFTLFVHDSNGCEATDEVKVSVMEIDATLTLNAGKDTTLCMGQKVQLLTKVQGGSAPYDYQWNSEKSLSNRYITNPIVSTTATTSYRVQVMDAKNNCSLPDDIKVSVNELPSIYADYNLAKEKYYINLCKDSMFTIKANANEVPTNLYTYKWSGLGLSSTTIKQPTCHPTITTTYTLTVSDNIGCSSTRDFVVDLANCDKFISGVAFYDENVNCLYDANEKPTDFLTILSSDFTRKYTVKVNPLNGVFEQSVPNDKYTIKPGYNNESNCANLPNFYTVDFNKKDSSLNNNFTIQKGLNYDLSISLFNSTQFRPGFAGEYIINYCNKSKLSQNKQPGTITLKLDKRLKNISSNFPFSSKTDSTITWKFYDLAPSECKKISVKFLLPTPAEGFSAGVILNAKAEIFADFDTDLRNNVAESIVAVVNSYDPNDKSVSPMRNPQGDILENDTWLNYVIRFQNTGNAEAINVVVEDEIDTKYLDLSTFRLHSTSHPVKLSRRKNLLIFTFEDIYLPDSASNETKSHGYINFVIKRFTVPFGTEINNKAAIYFDYNLPIITNTAKSKVVRRIVKPTKLYENKDDLAVHIFPNPSSDAIFIQLPKNANFDVTLYNMQGQLMLSQKDLFSEANTPFSISVAHFPKGIYILETVVDGKIRKEKVVVE